MAKKQELAAVRAAKARKRQRQKRKRRRIIIIVEVIILLALLVTAFVMAKFGKLQRVDLPKEEIEINEGISQEGYTTIALFGGDSREGALEEGTHADTIIIVSIDNESKIVRMSSIYRDTLLQQINGTYRKANNAYFVGGPREAINVLNKNLDLDIEYYATVDFKAMSDAVDAMGGLELTLSDEEAEALNSYVKETARAAGKKANKLNGGGTYVLDGPQTVTYSRIRKLTGGDYKRTERQRIVIQKLFEKAKQTDFKTLNQIADSVFSQISTNMTMSEILSLAMAIPKYELSDSEGFPFEKEDGIIYSKAGDVVVALGLAENVKELHELLYPKETSYVVSDTVQSISNEIEYVTGVVRPEELDEKPEETEEEGYIDDTASDSSDEQNDSDANE